MHTIQNKKGLKFIIAATALWAGVALAQSGSYPNKPIKFIVPYPPGGGTDVIARIVQEPLSSNLGQQVIIENRGGAGGSIGSEAAARSAADGYTVLFTLSSHTINPAIYPKLTFNTEKDFLPVVTIASLPQILVANPDFPAKNVKDVIDMAKAKPGTVAYASVGNGSPGHLAGAMMAGGANVKMTHIPYRGGGPAVTDVMGGQVPLLWVSIPAAANFVKAGKLKALAVSTTKRSAVFPDVPTMIELGVNVVGQSPYGLLGPKGMPPEIVESIYQAFKQASAEPKVTEYLAKFIQVPWDKNPAEFRAFAEKYYVDVKPLLIKAGLAKS